MTDAPRQIFGLSRTAFPDNSFILLNGNDSTLDQSSHRQSNYEIQYVASGQAYISVNAKRLYLSEGDYVILEPGDLHTLKAKNSIRFYSVEFAVGDRVEELPVYSELRDALIRRRKEPVVSRKNVALQPVLENLFREWRDRKLAYVDYINALFLQILLLCCRDVFGSERDEQDPGDILDEFLAFIGIHMDDPDVLASFEKAYGYKRASLSRMAKRKYGKTVFQLYTEKRFEYAVSLLAEGRASITDIARRCAFSSVASFSKAFTNFYGSSPSRYVRADTADEDLRRDVYADFSTCSVFLPLQSDEESGQEEKAGTPPADRKEGYTNPKLQLL